MKMASRRFGKNTLCSILRGKQLISFIKTNSLLPEGFFISHEEFGFSTIRRRVLVIPKTGLAELNRELKNYGTGSALSKDKPTVQTTSVGADTQNIDSFQLEVKIGATRALIDFLKETMMIVYLANAPGRISDLDLVDVLIDSTDVMGGISGVLVPKSEWGRDNNEGRKWND